MGNVEREQKTHIENVRDRFVDYCGNPWNGVLGNLDNLNDPTLLDTKEKSREGLTKSWDEFFGRIEVFLNNDFEPNGAITHENLQGLLEHKDKNPLEQGVVEEVDNLYRSIVEKTE